MRLLRVAAVAGILTVLLAGPVAAGNSADLVVSKADSPDPVVAGSNVTYTITVQNLGPNDATGVTMSDPLPAQMTFVSLTSPGGWTLTAPAVGTNGTVSATLPTLTVAAGVQSFTLVVNVGAATPGGTVITNVASVASNVFDANPEQQRQRQPNHCHCARGHEPAECRHARADHRQPLRPPGLRCVAGKRADHRGGPEPAPIPILTGERPGLTSWVHGLVEAQCQRD